jgi:hypothetical protein
LPRLHDRDRRRRADERLRRLGRADDRDVERAGVEQRLRLDAGGDAGRVRRLVDGGLKVPGVERLRGRDELAALLVAEQRVARAARRLRP